MLLAATPEMKLDSFQNPSSPGAARYGTTSKETFRRYYKADKPEEAGNRVRSSITHVGC